MILLVLAVFCLAGAAFLRRRARHCARHASARSRFAAQPPTAAWSFRSGRRRQAFESASSPRSGNGSPAGRCRSTRDEHRRHRPEAPRRRHGPAAHADELPRHQGLLRPRRPPPRLAGRLQPRPRWALDGRAAGRWIGFLAPDYYVDAQGARSQGADPRRAARRARPARRERRGRHGVRRRAREDERAHGRPARRGVRAHAERDEDRREPPGGAEAARRARRRARSSRPSRARSSRPTSSARPSAASCASRPPTRACAVRPPPRRRR